MKKFAVIALIALGLSSLLFFYFSSDNNSSKTDPLKEMEASSLGQELKSEIPTNFEQEIFINSFGMKFVKIPAGSFVMGSGLSPAEVAQQYGGKKEWYEGGLPQHRVTITIPFYVQTTEVTVGQWRSFIEDAHYKTEAETDGGATILSGNKFEKKEGYYWNNPGFEQTDKSPVTCISWNDANAFIKWLGRKEKRTYRLPTEAEWEYACRAGSADRFYFGNDQTKLGKYAWYWNNSKNRSHEVGAKLHNAWGLYDVLGNVWEWCQDWYGKYPPNAVTDPKGPSSGSAKVFRGGSIYSHGRLCRSAYRGGYQPDGRFTSLGFRLVLIQ